MIGLASYLWMDESFFFMGSSTTLVNSQMHINDIINDDARSREKCKFFFVSFTVVVVIKKAMEDVSDDDDKDLLTKLLKAKKNFSLRQTTRHTRNKTR